jgi:ribosomal protein S18 acetylase RimI-like enzyme
MDPLDNVIWHALKTRHSRFAEIYGNAARFTPDVTLFAAFEGDPAEGYASLSTLASPEGVIRLFLESPYEERQGWTHVAGARVVQMIWDGEPERRTSLSGSISTNAKTEGLATNHHAEAEIVQLGAADSREMMELTALTKPGPFEKRTHELGTYLGIRREGKLIAITGERMKVPGFTEVSAVCTHPQHTGRGYARMLMNKVMQGIFDRGETPFLHVREGNARAIELYERLGFRERKVVNLAVLRKQS